MHRMLLWIFCLFFLLSVPFVSAEENVDLDDFSDENGGDDCPDIWGNSTVDRQGCLDSDGDGYSDPDVNWTIENGADAFPSRNDSWLDFDRCLDSFMEGC